MRNPLAQRVLLTGVLLVVLGACAPPSQVRTDTPAASAGLPWTPPAAWAPQPIAASEYAARRAALARQLGDGVFLAVGSVEPDLDYLPYEQEANFRYLTGIREAGAALVMVMQGGSVEEIVFVRPRDPAYELWEGRRIGVEGARTLTGIADARTIDRLHPVLDELLAQHQTLYTTAPVPEELERHEHLDARQFQNLHILLAHPEVEQVSALEVLEELRAIKSPAELDLIRAAAYISNLAHLQLMRSVEPGVNEFEIHGIVEYTFFRNGAERPGYAPIVGSGPNSTTLHYRQNDRFMQAGDVLLVDAGAAYQGYTADITRTMPVNGRFSPEQRAIYQAVLEAQKAAEARTRPGATWDDLNEAVNAVIANRLAELGLIDAPDAMMRCDSPRWGEVCPQFRLWYMHGLGHGVGLNVHDPDISYYGPMRAGSVFTIEPGIYIRRDMLDHIPDTPENRALAERLRPVVARYRDIGVRIEDMYIVTETGVERLSAGVPREIDEIEALLATERIGRRDRVPHAVDWYRRMPQR